MDENKQKKSEKGQVLILLVLALTGIFAFAALAIDGAMIYSDRRIGQNAADASALTGIESIASDLKYELEGDWNCNNYASEEDSAKDAAILNAIDNDFTIAKTSVITEDNGVITCCYPNPDPSCPDNGSGSDEYLDVHVRITEQTNTSFAHLFFNDPISNTVNAVTRMDPSAPVAEGKTIIALTEDCKNEKGIFFNGTITLTVNSSLEVDGGIWSNSCIETKGGHTGVIDVTDGTITYNEDWPYDPTNMTINPDPVSSPTTIDVFIDEPPGCDLYDSDDDYGNYTGAGTISPGKYDGISVPNGDLEMESGLYCIYGGGFSVRDSITVSNPDTAVAGVTIAIYWDKGVLGEGVNIAGNGDINLFSPPVSCTQAGDCPNNAVGGLLIWVAPDPDLSDNKEAPIVSITGTPDSFIAGTIYNHDGDVIIAGNPDVETGEIEDVQFGIAVIGDSIKFSGNASLDFDYQKDFTYHVPAKIHLVD